MHRYECFVCYKIWREVQNIALWLPAQLSTYSGHSCTLLRFLSVDTLRYYVPSYLCSETSLYSQTGDLHRNGFPGNDGRIVCEVWRYSRKHFWRIRKIAKSGCYLHVPPSVRPQSTTRYRFDEIIWNSIFEDFSKYILKIKFWLKSYESNGYLAWRPMFIYKFSLSSSWNEKCFIYKL